MSRSAPSNPLNRSLADGVRKVGFRKWYERELLSSHAHMVLAFLCCIAVMGILEAFSFVTAGERLLDVAMFIFSAALGVWALRRYLFLLMHAEAVANQAVCPKCGAYGLFNLLSEDRPAQRIHVRCRKCNTEWDIEHG